MQFNTAHFMAYVKTCDIINVKVLEINVQRKRIGLTTRLNDEMPTQPADSKSAWINAIKENKSMPASTTGNTPTTPKLATIGALIQEAAKARKYM